MLVIENILLGVGDRTVEGRGVQQAGGGGWGVGGAWNTWKGVGRELES